MDLQTKLASEIKTAMLERDAQQAEVLRGLKSAILYEKISKNKKDSDLTDQEVIAVFKREAKKRGDAIELYEKAGNQKSAEKERYELDLIKSFLPEMLSQEEVLSLFEEALSDLKIDSLQRSDTGKIIAHLKKQVGERVDAKMVAEIIGKKISEQKD